MLPYGSYSEQYTETQLVTPVSSSKRAKEKSKQKRKEWSTRMALGAIGPSKRQLCAVHFLRPPGYSPRTSALFSFNLLLANLTSPLDRQKERGIYFYMGHQPMGVQQTLAWKRKHWPPVDAFCNDTFFSVVSCFLIISHVTLAARTHPCRSYSLWWQWQCYQHAFGSSASLM